jgi:hypothetical protein
MGHHILMNREYNLISLLSTGTDRCTNRVPHGAAPSISWWIALVDIIRRASLGYRRTSRVCVTLPWRPPHQCPSPRCMYIAGTCDHIYVQHTPIELDSNSKHAHIYLPQLGQRAWLTRRGWQSRTKCKDARPSAASPYSL